MKATKKLGKELAAGDVVKFLGREKTITHFTDHPGLDGVPARVALSGNWGITVFSDDFVEVIDLESGR
jgi:hypothetical protein